MALTAHHPLPLGGTLQRLCSTRRTTAWVMEVEDRPGTHHWRRDTFPVVAVGWRSVLMLSRVKNINLCFGIRSEALVWSGCFLRQHRACADCFALGCLLWVACPQPMSQRAAAAMGAAALLPPPSPAPLTYPLCPDTLTPSRMQPAAPRSPHLPLHPCRPCLRGRRRHLLRSRRPCPPTPGRSVESAASSGSPYQRRRCAGSPTSGRWRCGSSSTRLTSALWRSSLGIRRRRRHVRERPTPGPQITSPGLGPSRRAPKRR